MTDDNVVNIDHWNVEKACAACGATMVTSHTEVPVCIRCRNERGLRSVNDVARAEEEMQGAREHVARMQEIIDSIALIVGQRGDDPGDLDGFEVLRLHARALADDCASAESQRDQAQAAFNALLAQTKEDDRRARDAGLTHDNIRKAMSDHAADEISFGRLVEIVRASARLLAETGQFTPMITYSGPSPTTVAMVRCIKCHVLTRSNVQCVACGTRNVTTPVKKTL